MGGSRIFDWGGLRIDNVRDDGPHVALFPFKSWPIGGGHEPVPSPLKPAFFVLFGIWGYFWGWDRLKNIFGTYLHRLTTFILEVLLYLASLILSRVGGWTLRF